ncbi:Autophagy-related protein 9A [Geodia barretti]|uniref:Autophagy-related protein 9 n=1 Tax=Geodia barretti TaxID=519541 RepID=A0AA35SAS5_GEOBA|nr:Autophagy-related protein 9A [Geodia barretti]
MPHKQTDSFLFVHVVVSALPLCMYVRNMPSFSLQYVGTAGVCSTGGSVILAAQSLPDSQTFPAVLGDTELLPPCPRNIHFSDAQRDMGRDSGEAETSPERSQNEHQKTGTNRTGCVPSHPEVPELSGAMINKNILPCKIHVPFYGEKVFFTHGLKLNYELLLFWGPGAPFRNSFYLHEDYKSASKKYELISKLRFRIGLLALLNLLFCPVIFLYQILFSFFHYAEILKRHPGVFGKRRWSLYGRYHLRDFNELDHELALRLNRAYTPSVKYMDLFTHPIVTIVAQNVAFVAGSVLAVLLVLTVIQEDLLTAHNVLTFITLLGIIVTACRVFIPDENQVWIPAELMHEILGEIHYMPDRWKQEPHTVEVYKEYTQVFQFTLMYILDEMFSPLVTPFILYLSLRKRAPQIVDFLRNFTIDVSGVGDVCSFAEMNVKKHGNSEWLTPGMTRAGDYEKAELGKTEISLVQFSRKNPGWRPNEDGTLFMSQLKESAEEMQRSSTSAPGGSLLYPTLHTSTDLQDVVHSGPTPTAPPPDHTHHSTLLPPSHPTTLIPQGMQWSVWSAHGGHLSPPHHFPHLSPPHHPPHFSPTHHPHHIPTSRSDPLAISTLQLHQIHDYRKAVQTSLYTPHTPPTTQHNNKNNKALQCPHHTKTDCNRHRLQRLDPFLHHISRWSHHHATRDRASGPGAHRASTGETETREAVDGGEHKWRQWQRW